MKLLVSTVLVLLALTTALPAAAQKVTRESIDYLGTPRYYFQLIPKSAGPGSPPAPLLVLLHGSGGDGDALLAAWAGLAKKQGIVLVAPLSKNPRMWHTVADDPGLFQQIVEAVRGEASIDPRRIYLFGHSAGACYALLLSLLESEYFAATAVHAGNIGEAEMAFFQKARRKIPVHLAVGTKDPLFPLAVVRATRDAFEDRGFPVELVEIPRHDHQYGNRARTVNGTAWDFLERHSLSGDPLYHDHGYSRYSASSKSGS
jgi:poly(3-hydroxybutyrate) depolymerase